MVTHFRELRPILRFFTNRGISLNTRGRAYNACVHSVMLFASETWAPKVADIDRLTRNHNSMCRWICSVKISDRRSMSELRHWATLGYLLLMMLLDGVIFSGLDIFSLFSKLLAIIHMVGQ